MGEKRQEKIWTGQFWIAVINNFFLFVVHYALLTSLPLYILYELNGNEGQAVWQWPFLCYQPLS